jgi:hypothetical protein
VEGSAQTCPVAILADLEFLVLLKVDKIPTPVFVQHDGNGGGLGKSESAKPRVPRPLTFSHFLALEF